MRMVLASCKYKKLWRHDGKGWSLIESNGVVHVSGAQDGSIWAIAPDASIWRKAGYAAAWEKVNSDGAARLSAKSYDMCYAMREDNTL